MLPTVLPSARFDAGRNVRSAEDRTSGVPSDRLSRYYYLRNQAIERCRPASQPVDFGQLFNSPEAQVELWWEYCRRFPLYIRRRHFDELEAPPICPDGRLTTVVLEPWMRFRHQTVERELNVIKAVYDRQFWHYPLARLRGGECAYDTLRGTKGVTLKWRVIDLGANRDQIAPQGVDASAGLTALAAAIMHPRWWEAMNGMEVPYVWLPGIELMAAEGSSLVARLMAEPDRQGRPRLCFDARWKYFHSVDTAVPELIG